MMKNIVAVLGVLVVVGVVTFAMLSGKPNESPKQHPEVTPDAARAQGIDPKSTGRPSYPQ